MKNLASAYSLITAFNIKKKILHITSSFLAPPYINTLYPFPINITDLVKGNVSDRHNIFLLLQKFCGI